MARTVITDEMRNAIGAELCRVESFPVSEADIRRWAMAVYFPEDPPRLYWDPQYAARTVHGSIVAPKDFNPFVWMAAGGTRWDTGTSVDLEKSLGIEVPGLRFPLNGGMEAEYGVRMRPGDVIMSVRRLVSYHEREGRLGLMLFTVTEDVWTNQDGKLVRTTRQTSIRY
jgi:hypothetical protein